MTFHIAYACNEKYVEQTMVSMASVMEHNQDQSIMFYLIGDKISSVSIHKIKRLIEKYRQHIIFKTLDELLNGIEIALDDRHPKTIYAKLFLDSICDADRILYLDSDTVIMSSLLELWRIDLLHAYIAGVAMPYTDYIKKKVGLSSTMDYFCDGIVMINLEKWRKCNVAQKCRIYIEKKNGNPYMLSEGVINAVAGKYRVTLPPKYNLMSTMILWDAAQIRELFQVTNFYTQKEIEQARKDPVIIHYLNELYIRPWYSNSNHPYRIAYVNLRKKIGCNTPMIRNRQNIRTKGVMILNRILPFQWFQYIYIYIFKRKKRMNKKYLTKTLWVKIIIGIIVIAGVFFYAANHEIKYCESNKIQNTGTDTIGSIIDGNKVQQYFSYDGDYIRYITLKVGTYARRNNGILYYNLKDNNKIIFKGKKNISDLVDNEDAKLQINQNVKGTNTKYKLTLWTNGCKNENNSITLYETKINKIYHGKLLLNNKTSDAELQMSIYGSVVNKYGDFYWLYIFILCMIFSVWYYIEYKKENAEKNGFLHNICYTLHTYRFLIKQLVSRDFKTKYKRSVLGAFWSFLNPLCTMAVQYVVFSTIFRSNIENYPVYLLSASILFNYFTESVGGGLVSIVGNASLIKKVYVPKYIYPVTKVLSTAINLLISMLPLLVVIFITGERINKAYMLIPFVVFCLMLFCIGMSLIMSTLMVFFRDMQFLWSVISLLWMYATPLFYPESIIPNKFKFVLVCNPMYHYITFFRHILLGYASPQMGEYIVCLAFSVAICIFGYFVFNKAQKKFVLYL